MLALGEDKRARADQDHRAFSHQGEERDRAVAARSSPSTAARCRTTATRSKRCRASAAKPRTCVLNVAFGEPTIAVDTHIFRVGNRTGLRPARTPLDVEMKLEAPVPPEYRHNAHHWLILHGRYVCKAKKPECWRCAIASLCKFEPKTPAPRG